MQPQQMIDADQMDLSKTASGFLIISINIYIFTFSIKPIFVEHPVVGSYNDILRRL